MKYLDEYRDADAAHKLAREIARVVTKPWCLMEVCGGQTHSILKYGLDELLPGGVSLLHGPGCPVCVTPVELIDKRRRSPRGRKSFSALSGTCSGCREAGRICWRSRPREETCASCIPPWMP